ncbi:MAG TPA: hypothetical protein GXX65_13750 [Methanosarcina sp.]|nr:hypothetical protein [Methanosarcina sp.]
MRRIRLNAWHVLIITLLIAICLYIAALIVNVKNLSKLGFNVSFNYLSLKSPQLTVSAKHISLIPFEILPFALVVENDTGEEKFKLNHESATKAKVFRKPEIVINVDISAVALFALMRNSNNEKLVIRGEIPIKVFWSLHLINVEKEYEMSQLFKNH